MMSLLRKCRKATIGYIKRQYKRIKENRAVFFLYTILNIMVIIALIRGIIIKNYESAALCALTLVLLILPTLLEGVMKIHIPPLLRAILYCFIFASEIMGELENYYTKFPIWDTLLHALNGFLFAAIGFAMIYLLNRNTKRVNLSPLYLTLAAFCFSMTIGVLWEFAECMGDMFFHQDMQKDYIVQSFQSVKLDPDNTQRAIAVSDIIKTQIFTSSGDVIEIKGGYLDIGIRDTMKDLIVNFIGAAIFCFFGYFYLKSGSEKKVFAPVVEGLMIMPTDESEEESEGAEEVAAEKTDDGPDVADRRRA